MTKSKKIKKEKPLKLNMTFEEAMQKALNTPIPKGISSGKKKKTKGEYLLDCIWFWDYLLCPKT